MTLSLETRVRDFVRQHPGLTSTEIARGVRARFTDVLDVLASEAFSASLREAYPADRAQVYRVVPVAGEKQGRAARRTQCDLIAEVLDDREWHTTAEIHQRCGFSRLNSRISELRRRRSMAIECRHVDGQHSGPNAYEYRLTGIASEASEAADTLAGDAAAPSGESAASDGPAAQLNLSPDADGRLLTEAAGPFDSQLGEAA